SDRPLISGYLDGLALVDRTVGDLRAALERVGLWDRTTVLLSSDHYFRSSRLFDQREDHRIPFLLKLAGQKSSFHYSRPFSTIVDGRLLLAVLAGEVGDAASVSEWLD